MHAIQIGNKTVGPGHPCYIVAEIGINHNGSLDIARQLIHAAAEGGADAVKFQKRTIELCYTTKELSQLRESPFGNTNGDLKRALEFNEDEYGVINSLCQEFGVAWFASPWDVPSVTFLERLDVPCHKIASALLTDLELVQAVRDTGKPVILSTGMSTHAEIEAAGYPWRNTLLMHCTSAYPCDEAELNLLCVQTLEERYGVPVGYSGHEKGIATTVAAVALGACMVERHITLDRTMFGSDQAASLEPTGFARMCRDIRAVEAAIGDGVKRVYDSELPALKKLRRVKSA